MVSVIVPLGLCPVGVPREAPSTAPEVMVMIRGAIDIRERIQTNIRISFLMGRPAAMSRPEMISREWVTRLESNLQARYVVATGLVQARAVDRGQQGRHEISGSRRRR